jgi:hypothetical protein
MPHSNESERKPLSDDGLRYHWPWARCLSCALLLVVAFFVFHHRRAPVLQEVADNSGSPDHLTPTSADESSPRRSTHEHRATAPKLTAEEIVASKVAQFGQKRRGLVRAIAQRTQKEIPPEVEKFFDAVESGNWEKITNQWYELSVHSSQYTYSTNHWEQLDPFWPSVLDAYGVAEQAHLWPAQKLLDYGNAINEALRPGMVYVGGSQNC